MNTDKQDVQRQLEQLDDPPAGSDEAESKVRLEARKSLEIHRRVLDALKETQVTDSSQANTGSILQ